MKRIPVFLLLLFLFLIQNALPGQTNTIDSLESVLKHHKRNDTTRIRLLNSLALALYENDNERMYELASEAIQLSDKRKDPYGKAEGIRLLGKFHYNLSQHEQAESYFRESLAIYESLDDKAGISRCMDNLGREYWRQGKYDTAEEQFDQALDLARDLDDHELIATSLGSLAILSLSIGEYNKAEEYLEASSEQARLAGNLKILSSNLHNLGYLNMQQSNFDQAIAYFEESAELMEKVGDKQGISGIYLNIGLIYQDQGQYIEAIDYYQRSIEIDKIFVDKRGISMALNNIGLIYQAQGNYFLSLDYLQRSLKIKEEIGDRDGVASCLMNIGIIHGFMDDFNKALEYYFRSLEILEELKDKSSISQCLLDIGNAYRNQKAFNKALEYLKKALEMKVELGEPYGESTCLASLGDLYLMQGEYGLAMENYLKSLEIKEEISDIVGICNLYYNIGSVYLKTGNFRQAGIYTDSSLTMALELELLGPQVMDYKQLSDIQSATGDYYDAYKNHVTHKELYDSLLNKENIKKITGLEYEFNFEKEKRAIELEQQKKEVLMEAEAHRQLIVRNTLLGGLVAITIIVFLISYSYIQKKKDNQRIKEKNAQIREANDELQQLNEEISAQKEEIEAQRDSVFNQNEAITESINYAQRIQSAMLPPESYIHELLDDVFILFKPRDIVSGDFYWIKQVNQYSVIAAADCTGHGVPGAFMSMLGMSFLTEIVQRREITQANEILDEMRRQIKHALRQHGQPDETKDGIDMALCVINQKTRAIQYAGANSPIYIIQEKNGNPELKEIKADRMPLGYHYSRDRPFTNHEINLETGDAFYLFSDGFIDQKGGKENKKYMSKNFKRLLMNIHEQPMYDQKKTLEKELGDWIGEKSQIDDILVIGVRV
jgi:tetratricopeptide (TPR) repeat protein